MVLVVPRRYALGRHNEITFRESLDNDFVGPAVGSAQQETLNHHAAHSGRQLRLRNANVPLRLPARSLGSVAPRGRRLF